MKPSTCKQIRKPRNIHNSKDVFPIDIRSLGRPLNAAMLSLSPYFVHAVTVLEQALNNMTRRNDCQVSLLSYGLDVSFREIPDREAISFSHSEFNHQCIVSISQPFINLVAEAFYGGTPHFSPNKPTALFNQAAAEQGEEQPDEPQSTTSADNHPDTGIDTDTQVTADSYSDDFSVQPLNASEKRVQARIAATILNELSHKWQVSTDTSKIKNGTLSAVFSVQIEDTYGEINLQLDEELLLKLTAKDMVKTQDPQQLETLRELHLKKVPLRLNAVLSRQTLALDQVLKLKVGDIITSDIQEIVEVNAGSQPLYQAHVVERNGHLVLQVVNTITPQERN